MSHRDLYFADIHCHILPGIDDGAADLKTCLQMATIAVDDGITTIVATPHQLGGFSQNRGEEIRQLVQQTQQAVNAADIPLRILPGADVRIEPNMISAIRRGEVLTLADQSRHVLLELPHELYFPVEPVLDQLHAEGLQGILSHPERNAGLLARPKLVEDLVQHGCLMQVTAGSLLGTFGPASLQMAEWMLANGLIHFLASDAHGARSRRPLLRRSYERACELANETVARMICCENPLRVVQGEPVKIGRLSAKKRTLVRWLARTAA